MKLGDPAENRKRIAAAVAAAAAAAGQQGELSMGKLSGITVIDLSVFLPGPMMTVMMADQGANIIKIEAAAGDPAREQAPFEAGQGLIRFMRQATANISFLADGKLSLQKIYSTRSVALI